MSVYVNDITNIVISVLIIYDIKSFLIPKSFIDTVDKCGIGYW